MLDPGRWTLNAGGCTLDTVFWTLDIVVDWFRTESEHSFLFCLVKLLKILRVQICKELLVTLILFLYLVNFVLMLSVTLKKNTERRFYCEKSNYIKATISYSSEAAFENHPFSKISPEATGGRVLFLVKLETDCLE